VEIHPSGKLAYVRDTREVYFPTIKLLQLVKRKKILNI
jgi:hypothetical protein